MKPYSRAAHSPDFIGHPDRWATPSDSVSAGILGRPIHAGHQAHQILLGAHWRGGPSTRGLLSGTRIGVERFGTWSSRPVAAVGSGLGRQGLPAWGGLQTGRRSGQERY